MPATRRYSPGSLQMALRGILLAVIAKSSLAFHLASHYGVRLGQHGRSHFVQQRSRGGLPTPRTAAFSRGPSLGALRVQLSAKAEKSDQDLLEDAYEVLNVADIGFSEAALLLERSQRASAKKGEVLVEEGQDVTVPAKERRVFLILSGSLPAPPPAKTRLGLCILHCAPCSGRTHS
jgi:hypothetical protein